VRKLSHGYPSPLRQRQVIHQPQLGKESVVEQHVHGLAAAEANVVQKLERLVYVEGNQGSAQLFSRQALLNCPLNCFKPRGYLLDGFNQGSLCWEFTRYKVFEITSVRCAKLLPCFAG
jgi:hypothetical protein